MSSVSDSSSNAHWYSGIFNTLGGIKDAIGNFTKSPDSEPDDPSIFVPKGNNLSYVKEQAKINLCLLKLLQIGVVVANK